MKKGITLTFLLASLVAKAQNDSSQNKYYTNGSIAIGVGRNTFADTSAWLQIAGDSTNKGILFPKVRVNNISTTKRGLFVYSLQDSSLYHLDGSKKIKYLLLPFVLVYSIAREYIHILLSFLLLHHLQLFSYKLAYCFFQSFLAFLSRRGYSSFFPTYKYIYLVTKIIL